MVQNLNLNNSGCFTVNSIKACGTFYNHDGKNILSLNHNITLPFNFTVEALGIMVIYNNILKYNSADIEEYHKHGEDHHNEFFEKSEEAEQGPEHDESSEDELGLEESGDDSHLGQVESESSADEDKVEDDLSSKSLEEDKGDENISEEGEYSPSDEDEISEVSMGTSSGDKNIDTTTDNSHDDKQDSLSNRVEQFLSRISDSLIEFDEIITCSDANEINFSSQSYIGNKNIAYFCDRIKIHASPFTHTFSEDDHYPTLVFYGRNLSCTDTKFTNINVIFINADASSLEPPMFNCIVEGGQIAKFSMIDVLSD